MVDNGQWWTMMDNGQWWTMGSGGQWTRVDNGGQWWTMDNDGQWWKMNNSGQWTILEIGLWWTMDNVRKWTIVDTGQWWTMDNGSTCYKWYKLVPMSIVVRSASLFLQWHETGKIPVLGKPTHMCITPASIIQQWAGVVRPLVPQEFFSNEYRGWD